MTRRYYRRFIGFRYTFDKVAPSGKEELVLDVSLPATPNVQVNQQVFTFLNQCVGFPNQIDWNYDQNGKLWTYNLNYFEFLHLPDLTVEEGLTFIRSFNNSIEEHRKDGLEPYPLSLRLIHTIKFLSYHKLSDQTIDHSLYNQFWLLMDQLEYHILGNHLLENGFSLLFGAYYFNDNKLYAQAKSILLPELDEQILADGAHFELSPMYHQLMLYRVLDCINLVKNNPRFGQELLSLFEKKASSMLSWLQEITFKNGQIPLLNDSSEGINPSSMELLDYAKRLDIKPLEQTLGESGYRKFTGQVYELICDIGSIGPDYLPGHAHCDIFSFVLHHNQQALIIDPGVSTYNSGSQRMFERSTALHNTVFLAPYEQAQIWDSFRVAKRPHPIILNESTDSINAEFSYVNTNAKHQREFNFSGDKILIKDTVTGTHEAIAHFHLAPNIDAQQTSPKQVVLNGVKVHFNGAINIILEEYQCAIGFNRLKSAFRIAVNFSGNLETRFEFAD